MFSWVTAQLETISQAVAPPPTDPPSLFVHCCTRGDEQGAMEAAYQFAAVDRPISMVVVHAGKQQTALHVACQYCLPRVMDYLITSSNGSDMNQIIHVRDASGNTPLHAAASATGSSTLERDAIVGMVQRLITEYQASPVVKNDAHQTPYDVATLDRVRQYLLPIQLQRETQEALDNGGVGLPPGVDLGGLKINYSNSTTMGPPPMAMTGPPPMQMPGHAPPVAAAAAPSVFDTPLAAHKTHVATSTDAMPAPPLSSNSQASTLSQSGSFDAPPSSGGSGTGYATRGYSSAHIYNPKGKRVLKPDGFHSSSSDKRLQEKYGHSQAPTSGQGLAPPPPISGGAAAVAPPLGNSSAADASSPAAMAGPNPFAGGHSVFASGGARVGLQRYVPVDPMTGRPLPQPQPPMAAVSAPAAAMYSAPPAAMFIPGAAAVNNNNIYSADPIQQPPVTTFMPPPATPAAAPLSGGVPCPAPTSGTFFPPPPRRSDAISPRTQSLSTFPSPPAAVSFPSPPRAVSGATNSTMGSPSTTATSLFAAPPQTVTTPSADAASSVFSASKFPAPPSVSAASKFPSPPTPSATATSLFASPPAARVASAPMDNVVLAETFTTETLSTAQPPALSAQEMFSTPQPAATLQSVFSSPRQSDAAEDNGITAEAVSTATARPLEPTRPVIPSAPKSGESVRSAAELFGSPPNIASEAVEEEVSSFVGGGAQDEEAEGEEEEVSSSVGAAQDEYASPPVDVSAELKPTAAELVGERVGDSLDATPKSDEPELSEPVAPAQASPVVETEQPESSAVSDGPTESYDSPSKLMDDESEMLLEVPLSPTKKGDE